MKEAWLEVQIDQAGYEPGNPAIEQVSFSVRPGVLTGLIGPNGAGKSTTLKAILGLLPYAEMSVQFLGGQGHYAYIPEQPVFYESLTLWEHLELAAAVYGMEEQTFEREAEALLDKFRMTEARDLQPGSFSKGMQQKMMLMIGFLSRPNIYILSTNPLLDWIQGRRRIFWVCWRRNDSVVPGCSCPPMSSIQRSESVMTLY